MLFPSRRNKLTWTKPAHLTRMPGPSYSLIHLCFWGSIILPCQFACQCLCCLLISTIQPNKVASSLLHFVAFWLFFFSFCTHKKYFYLVLVELFQNMVTFLFTCWRMKTDSTPKKKKQINFTVTAKFSRVCFHVTTSDAALKKATTHPLRTCQQNQGRLGKCQKQGRIKQKEAACRKGPLNHPNCKLPCN